MSSNALERMLRRAALEVRDGDTVNLGIGHPTKLPRYLDPSVKVCIHSENGVAGMGPRANPSDADRNLIDAGGNYITTLAGASYFDSAVSFGIIRGGNLDLTMLGAFEVASNGDLANWMIPGRFTPGIGGAVELAQKARRVIVLTNHVDKSGKPKLVDHCTLPLTAPQCVHRVITDLAVIDVSPDGFELVELFAGVSIEEIQEKTESPLAIPQPPSIFH
ncbi:MAG: 3-oxoacid CoA-transferase subunit B [Mesorhizobium sp.]|uniref:3-oxoacid CoA-transferase subunit B n=1 Tax=Mesorhizobium sp. TaxID=1871066 RepID=UPI00120A0108|nr:3-oxoacid CoA-transferase subunit B [Mesorhizobium sp.]TIL60577.1 MAG: 3-oxoacid CoA-transferase subunit B [Mesorhizobium sp.]